MANQVQQEVMLLSLRWSLERHPGVPRQVAWPRVKTALSREDAYAKVVSSGGVFIEDASRLLNQGSSFALRTTAGATYSGRTEFLRNARGFCLSVSELNDALFWLTIEGTPGKVEVQIWLSAFGLPAFELQRFSEQWKKRLTELVG
jgi:hypothetical protein